jgi:nucleotide-binding universal stress UspA family protein
MLSGKEKKMAKKVLIAFDDSENAFRGVTYVADTFKTDIEITLFGVVPDTADICQMESKELIPYFKSQRSAFCSIEEKKKDLLSQAMQNAKKTLVEAGFDESKIITKITTKKSGIARDIVTESKEGYDSIVIGRRGISGIKEMFLGSISQKVISLAKDASICIIN